MLNLNQTKQQQQQQQTQSQLQPHIAPAACKLNPVVGGGGATMYTYNLPYATRRSICDLLDADQSWRTLGGQFLAMNGTQLTLIGQAYLRNGSPTEELLNKLDSANVKVSELSSFLKHMNHHRALEVLRQARWNHENQMQITNFQPSPQSPQLPGLALYDNNPTTLDTPTPSFVEQPAILGRPSWDQPLAQPSTTYDWLMSGGDPFLVQPVSGSSMTRPIKRVQYEERNSPLDATTCHNRSSKFSQSNQRPVTDNQQVQIGQQPPIDLGKEIVRAACANNQKRTSISDEEVVNQLRLIMQITYNELKHSSNDFSPNNILGNGGFAIVYRGNYKGTDVAIKRLKGNLMDQALNELTMLNSYRIDNILPIYGISLDGPEACLVYQFMANGSLEDRLLCKQASPPLTWSQRVNIGEGVAKALFYLHTLRVKPLVHGDVKSANVLLDAQFVPKLGDFGLARQMFDSNNPEASIGTHCTVSSIHGTSVYLPPEYLRNKNLSPGVDVYSYGIVLLEMATGRRAFDGKKLLIELVTEEETRSMSTGQIISDNQILKDHRLAIENQSDLVIWHELLFSLGLNCAHQLKKKRPDMGKVLACFAVFRSGSNSTRGHILNSIIGPISTDAAGSATTTNNNNTFTPDPTIPVYQNQNQNQNQNQQQQQLDEQNQYQYQYQGHVARPQADSKQPQESLGDQVLNDGLKLMSIEEEPNLFIDHGGHATQNGAATTGEHQRANNSIVNNDPKELQSEAAAVEDMIPLLTELGVVTNQDQ